MRPRYSAGAITRSTNQKARTEHFRRASKPPPVHPRLEVGGAMLRPSQREPIAEVAIAGSTFLNVPARPLRNGGKARASSLSLAQHPADRGESGRGSWRDRRGC